jgi:uncharacterized protein (DUF2342 family)
MRLAVLVVKDRQQMMVPLAQPIEATEGVLEKAQAGKVLEQVAMVVLGL